MSATSTAHRVLVLIASTALFLSAGCGDGEPSATAEAPTAWAGQEAHFVAVGSINDAVVDIDLGVAASDPARLSCVREFEIPLDVDGNPDYAAGKFVEVKLSVVPEEGGDRIEVELKRHDFSADTAGATVTVVPRDDTVEPAATEMWVEWEWHAAADDETFFESAAQTGSFDLGAHEGVVDSTGLVLTGGHIGGFLTARWSQTEEVAISFSAPCTEEKLSFIAQ